ncbi:hypothetical protein D9619_005863 [Psilocybe cf. subviscida]|uniref:Translation initiation factor IF-2, mitochondrial n=1 Tax=Psilocybe cf. subviscida TaxID=2480587 RepID=A0A8H5BX24_9AGAR|nr:hypothetical protein D9619_005863 [Psilocybe cf. subviscida]
MHRNCRVLAVFRNQCGCRSLATASAVQLKPKAQERNTESKSSSQTDASRPAKLPSAKSWTIPPPPPSIATSTRRPPITSSRPQQPSPTRWTPSPQRPTASPRSNTPIPTHTSSAPSAKSWSPPSQRLAESAMYQRTSRDFSPSHPSQRPSLSPAPAQNPSQLPKGVPVTPKDWSRPQPIASSVKETHHPSSSHRPSFVSGAILAGKWDSFARSPSRSTEPSTESSRPESRARDMRSHSSPDARSSYISSGPISTGMRFQERGNARPIQPSQPRTLPSAKELKTNVKPRRRTQKRKDVFIPSTLTVASLASILGVKLAYLQRTMKRVGMTEEANYDYILTSDYAVLLAEEMNFNPVVDDEAAFDILPPPPHSNPSSLPHRPPVVTIMGHVDHGKTTLLDTLRSASVAKGEAGGITQHIGAFSVPVKNSSEGPQTITFLDTPGHAAFSAMRARGADVTDIVVLVVAADDGIMPQTKEVINLLKKEDSEISLVVAINKVDKPGADTDAVKLALMAEGVQLEEFGGDVPAVHVSGLTGEGLPELVETLSMVAEMQDLRAEHEGPVFGHVLESNFHKGLGPVATVLIARGCLEPGSLVISGVSQGKVRLMKDSNGNAVKKALPGMAVTVSGWKTLPKAGDEVLMGSESDIKKALANREKKLEEQAQQQDIEAINAARLLERNARAEGIDTMDIHTATDTSGPKELKLIIKADVSGSGEALKGALDAMGNKIAVSRVISTAVGDVTESDVTLAKAANATLIGFSVSVPRSIRNLASQNGVQIFTSDIIYRLVDDVRASLIDMLPKIVETKVVGEANVQQLFDIQLKGGKSMKVAGCRITNGKVEKIKAARVVRGGETVHEGMLDTMRQLKKDITEARKGVECGLSFKEFEDLREGDLIQTYETIAKPGIL